MIAMCYFATMCLALSISTAGRVGGRELSVELEFQRPNHIFVLNLHYLQRLKYKDILLNSDILWLCLRNSNSTGRFLTEPKSLEIGDQNHRVSW